MKTTKNFALPVIVLFILMTSCNVLGEQGNGNVVKQERKVGEFNGLDISGAFKVFLTQGETQSVVVEADDNLQPIIRTEVVGNTLRIDNKRSISNAKSLKIYITVKELKKIEVSGAVDIETQTKFTGNELSLGISGATDSDLEIAVQNLEVNSSGGSKLTLKGMANNFSLDVSGAVNVHAFDLLTEVTSIDISGAGEADVTVTKDLKADISGAAHVRYKGNPAKVWSDVSGAGSMKKED